MKTPTLHDITTQLILDAETAADLMTPNPVSIRREATVREAVALLTDKGISAVPVIDDAGRPVGVLSHTDILVHAREKVNTADAEAANAVEERKADHARVGELMTPVVFSVAPDTPASKVVSEMVSLNVHRLFVIEDGAALVGVISALDVLRRLTERPGE